jgi:hypothetical protein
MWTEHDDGAADAAYQQKTAQSQAKSKKEEADEALAKYTY